MSERQSLVFLNGVEKQKQSANHLFNSYETMVSAEACLIKDISDLEAKLVETRRVLLAHQLDMTRSWRFLDAKVKKVTQRTKEAQDYVTALRSSECLQASPPCRESIFG